jgi:hypothetical protein
MKTSQIIFLFLLCWCRASADTVGYGGKHEIAVESGPLVFRHAHDWDSKQVQALFFDLAHHEKFFSAANDFSFVELRDSKDKLLFRSPSPALTKLWISPDAQFLVGLSDIKLYNPYQLVVWRPDGTLLHSEHISADVAKLTDAQRREFAQRFPKAEQFLTGRYFTRGNASYLDYVLLGVPNEIGEAAWDYLYPLRVRHPYSNDFGESVTNTVNWFDPKRPEPSITRQGTDWVLSLRSPSGKLMTIPLKK